MYVSSKPAVIGGHTASLLVGEVNEDGSRVVLRSISQPVRRCSCGASRSYLCRRHLGLRLYSYSVNGHRCQVWYNQHVDVMGFVTAGGKSSRMGRDKAWLELGGRPMITHVLDALRPVVTEVAVIANGDDYDSLGVRVVLDVNKGIGPIEAVRAALDASRCHRVVLVGCDLPFVTTELFGYLLTRAGGYESVVPLGPDKMPEPLCAVYCRRSLPEVERMIAARQFKISPLFERVDTLFVSFDELSHLRGAELFFENINTPKQYQRALALGSASKYSP